MLGLNLVFGFLVTCFQAQVKSGFRHWVESQIQRVFVCRLYPRCDRRGDREGSLYNLTAADRTASRVGDAGD